MTEVEFINQPATLTKIKDAIASIAALGDLRTITDIPVMSH